ncbi:MAG: flagellar basal body rod protein FlgC [Gammaproteobacteria bacterium]|nr:flagellar basal body rod protein FlgC [Gammaproteobacteria bacterium]
MSLFNILNISGSGMSAENLRLNMIASNIANAETVASSAADAYKSKQPIFSTVMENATEEQVQGGVATTAIVQSKAEHARQYEPENPLADKEGYVYASNVDPVTEMTNMISASRNYQNNVQVFNTSKELVLRTLSLGQ